MVDDPLWLILLRWTIVACTFGAVGLGTIALEGFWLRHLGRDDRGYLLGRVRRARRRRAAPMQRRIATLEPESKTPPTLPTATASLGVGRYS